VQALKQPAQHHSPRQPQQQQQRAPVTAGHKSPGASAPAGTSRKFQESPAGRSGAYQHVSNRHDLPQLLPGAGVTKFVQFSVTRVDTAPVPADGVVGGSRQYTAPAGKAVPAGVLSHGNVRQYKKEYCSNTTAGDSRSTAAVDAATGSPRLAGAAGAVGRSKWVGGAWSSPAPGAHAAAQGRCHQQKGFNGATASAAETGDHEGQDLSALAAGLVMDLSLLL
jgi:hypothetical protein